MKDLSLDALRYQRDEETKLTMPYANTYSAALLFVDMSGFTKLSQMLDLESLSKVSQVLLCCNAISCRIVFIIGCVSFFSQKIRSDIINAFTIKKIKVHQFLFPENCG